MTKAKIFLFGFILGLVALPLCGYFYFRYGFAPVATAASPMPFEKQLAHYALNARIEKEAPQKDSFAPTDADFEEGAHLYRQHCAVCHGREDRVKTATAKGMFPEPPQLLVGKGVTDDRAGETYWKVSNGIRLTGMPAYRQSLTDKQMWQISFLLAQADKLPMTAQSILKEPLSSQ